jgi:protein TonB
MAVSSRVNGAREVHLNGPASVRYTYEVKNLGNVALTGLKLTDRDDVVPAFDGGDANSNKVLDVGETWRYRATARITRKQLDTSNAFVNRAVAVSDQGSSLEDSVTVTMAPPTAVRVGGNIPAPQKIRDVRPVYPPAAESSGVQGVVLLELTIGPDGRVQDARVTRSIPGLDQAALDAVRQWQYQPTLVEGAAVPVITTVAVQFRLVPQAADSAGTGGAKGQPPVAPVHVGGNISQPTRTTYVRPEYPPDAQAANVQGVVILEATIDTKGQVKDLKVLRSIPLLDQAAIDAVRQWEYTPTLLNGVPVPVIMTVTVNFTLQ